MSLEIIRPGLLTSIQDLGRFGYQDQGITVGGVMDSFSSQIANWLVGNNESEALIEMTMLGPTIRFSHPVLISMTGSDLGAKIDGAKVSLWRPVWVKEGSVLSLNGPPEGRYCYLAVRGGLDIPSLMGSCSTNLKGAFGGHKGRALLSRDIIKIKQASLPIAVNWGLDPSVMDVSRRKVIRVTKGAEWGKFPNAHELWNHHFTVSQSSDRMGYRLNSDLHLGHKEEMISTGVSIGTLQVPPSGNTIVLMADRQTTGGYPRVAQVITADLPLLAHALPGEKIKFKEVSLKEAHKILFEKKINMERIKESLRLKWSFE